MALVNTTDDCVLGNDTMNDSLSANCTGPQTWGHKPVAWTIINCIFWSVICVVGLLGNGLVIFVVLTYTKMKTVTNMYILNLAIADLCFLVGLPFLIVTATLQRWIFGFVICKIFYILTSINWFTSVFTLTVMSADRYLAVCHPISSMRYRTPLVSRLVCVVVWTASLLVMLPIMMYATLNRSDDPNPKYSCTLVWPKGQHISGAIAFLWYAFLLGFAIPVALISVFYALVLIRLKSVGPKKKSKEKKRSHRKVTKMVLTVITVYVVCWLPYWVFQMVLAFADSMPLWTLDLFQIITVMSYANSMFNPLLYAFLSDNFRKSFIKAFKCATAAEVNNTLQHEHSVFPGKKQNRSGGKPQKLKQAPSDEDMEFTTGTNMTMTTTTTNPATSMVPPEKPVQTEKTELPTTNNCSNNYTATTAIFSGNHTDNGSTPVTEV